MSDERDEDRLPWLETVEEDYDDGPSIWRILLYILLGLAALSGIIYGWFWYQGQNGGDGNGQLIAAQEGDYKVKPDDPGGMNVQGDGDAVYSTSLGNESDGSVDLNGMPEAPVKGQPAPAPSASSGPGAAKVVADVPSGSVPVDGAAKTPPLAASAGAGGAVVQLGSFPSSAEAEAAWSRLSKRFAYLAPLGKSIQQADVKGRTVNRLRVNAGSATQAKELCAKLTLAGEDCFIATN